MAIHLISPKLAAEGKNMARLRPGHRVSRDDRSSRERPLEGVSDERYAVTVDEISKRDLREIAGPSIPEAQLGVPVAGRRRRVTLLVPVVGHVKHVQQIRRKSMRLTDTILIRFYCLCASRGEWAAISCSRLPDYSAISQNSRVVDVYPRPGKAVAAAEVIVQFNHRLGIGLPGSSAQWKPIVTG